MAQPRLVDVQDVINSHPLSRFQVSVVALCFLVVAIDGFDTAAIGFIAPALKAGWGVTPAQLAPLFGAGLFGRSPSTSATMVARDTSTHRQKSAMHHPHMIKY